MRIAFLSAWNVHDPRAWSGMINRMYGALATRAEVLPVVTGEVPPALVDRAACRLLDDLGGRRYLVGHTVATGVKRARAARRELGRVRPDVIVAAVASQEAAFLRTHVPVVLVSDATFRAIRGYYTLYSRLHIPSSLQGELLEARSLKKAAACVFASTWAERSAIEDYSVPQDRCTVVPFGPALEPDASSRARSEPTGGLRLLVVASDWDRKGGDLAVSVFEGMRAAGLPVSLTVAGDTPQLPDSVRNLGPVDAATMRQLYSTHDVLLELAHANCAGVTLTDAAAFGLPVVATDTGGVSTIVEDGVTGFLVAPAKNIEEMVKETLMKLLEPGVHAAMSGRARQRYETRLNWDAWGRQVLEICSQVSAR